jgi:hypothetical protein
LLLPDHDAARLPIVFQAFISPKESFEPSGHDPLDPLRRDAEGGGKLRRIQNADPSARPRTYVKDTPAAFVRLYEGMNHSLNRFQFMAHCFRDAFVFLIHYPKDLGDRLLV